jgi:cobaltochelatase CobS
MRQNLAFMDRFWVVEVGYPAEDQEREILAAAVPDLPEVIRERMVSVANQVRRLFLGEADTGAAIEVTFSTRSLVRWAQLAWFFRGLAQQGRNPVIHALDRALAFRAAPETRQALHEIVQRELGEGEG